VFPSCFSPSCSNPPLGKHNLIGIYLYTLVIRKGFLRCLALPNRVAFVSIESCFGVALLLVLFAVLFRLLWVIGSVFLSIICFYPCHSHGKRSIITSCPIHTLHDYFCIPLTSRAKENKIFLRERGFSRENLCLHGKKDSGNLMRSCRLLSF